MGEAAAKQPDSWYQRGWVWILGHKMWTGIGAMATVIGVIVSIIAIVFSSSAEPSSTQTNDRCTANGSNIILSCSGPASNAPNGRNDLVSPNSKPDSQSSLKLATIWPWVSGCPAYGSALAMPVGGGALQDFHSAHDIGQTLAEHGAGSWVQGSMYLHLQAAKGKRLELIDLTPHIQRRDLAPPAWVYIPKSGCGPAPGDRHFILDLDKPLLTDAGIERSPIQVANAPRADLGTGFVIDDHNDVQIRLDTLSCAGNYQWTVAVRYVEAGGGDIKTVEIGPITSYGRADNSVRYVGWPGADGVVKVAEQTTITGGDPEYFKKACDGT